MKSNKPNKTTVHILGVDYDVEYIFIKGYPDTLEQPGEPDTFEINSIVVEESEDNQESYKKFLEEWEYSDTWLESEELNDAVIGELQENSSYDEEYDYPDYDDLYWDDYYEQPR